MYLGFDLGTSNVKAIVVADDGRAVGTGSAPVERFTTPDGGVEQDIEQIWAAVCLAIRQATDGLDAGGIRAVGVSSQGGALQLLDERQRPIGRVISWLDSRGQPFDQEITRELGEEFLAAHIGHRVSTMTIGQILRLREQAPQLLAAAGYIGFVGDVIVGRLCGHRAHDPTSLAIAMLYNPWQRRADSQVLARLGIEESQLPDLLPATTPAGKIHEDASRQTGLPAGVPVSPAVHDQYAVSLGAGSVHEGDVTFGAGTAWVLLANSTHLAQPVTRDAFVCPHPVPGLFGQLLSMRNGGSAIAWILKLIGNDKASAATVDQLLVEAPPGSDGLCFWPLLSPTAGVDDAFQSGGKLAGITLAHRPGHLLRAVVEGLACELARHLNLMAQAGAAAKRLMMCGSAAGSPVTPQIIADVTRLPVTCVDAFDVSALGAARIARALVERDIAFAHLTGAAAHLGRTLVPGPAASCYATLLERYMQPFDTHATRSIAL
jgi:xylulokinase